MLHDVHRPPPTAAHGRRLASARTRGAGALAALCAAAALTLAACASVSPPPAPHLEPDAGIRRVGVYVPSGVWNGLAGLEELEAMVGRPFDLAHWFASFDVAFDPVPVHDVLRSGRVPLITWQPMREDLRDIAAGVHDDYLRSWADGVRAAPGIVYLRPFPEMNGDWVPWNGDPDAFRAAWAHVTALFRDAGAVNVRWVWSPNLTDEPRTDANRMERYYPGHDQVDVLALSGYNWGETRPYIGWRTFGEMLAVPYRRLTDLGDQPVWMAETASTEVGGDKAAWIRDMFASAAAFPRLEAVVWFNENKETDWRLESSAAALRAFARSVPPPAEP